MNKRKLILATVLFFIPFFLQISWIVLANIHSDLSFLEIRDIYTDFIGAWVVEYKHTTAFLSFGSYMGAFTFFLSQFSKAPHYGAKGLILVLTIMSFIGGILSIWTIL